MSTPDRPWPSALVEVAASLLRGLEAKGHRPQRIEITFTPRALERLGRAHLGQLVAVRAFQGVPVEFPEQPSIWTVGGSVGPDAPASGDVGVIDVKAIGATGSARAALPAWLLAESSTQRG